MAERYLINGQLGDAALLTAPTSGDVADANQLMLEKWSDPVAGLLGAYLSLRALEARKQAVSDQKNSLLQTAVDNLRNVFPLFLDSHVIAAEMLIRGGKEDEAGHAAEQALNTGIPIFDEGLLRLGQAIERFKIEHERTSLLKDVIRKRVPGMIWTVYNNPNLQ